jgi:hypothetical protein
MVKFIAALVKPKKRKNAIFFIVVLLRFIGRKNRKTC